jgi:hypothetical protein
MKVENISFNKLKDIIAKIDIDITSLALNEGIRCNIGIDNIGIGHILKNITMLRCTSFHCYTTIMKHEDCFADNLSYLQMLCYCASKNHIDRINVYDIFGYFYSKYFGVESAVKNYTDWCPSYYNLNSHCDLSGLPLDILIFEYDGFIYFSDCKQSLIKIGAKNLKYYVENNKNISVFNSKNSLLHSGLTKDPITGELYLTSTDKLVVKNNETYVYKNGTHINQVIIKDGATPAFKYKNANGILQIDNIECSDLRFKPHIGGLVYVTNLKTLSSSIKSLSDLRDYSNISLFDETSIDLDKFVLSLFKSEEIYTLNNIDAQLSVIDTFSAERLMTILNKAKLIKRFTFFDKLSEATIDMLKCKSSYLPINKALERIGETMFFDLFDYTRSPFVFIRDREDEKSSLIEFKKKLDKQRKFLDSLDCDGTVKLDSDYGTMGKDVILTTNCHYFVDKPEKVEILNKYIKLLSYLNYDDELVALDQYILLRKLKDTDIKHTKSGSGIKIMVEDICL